VPSPRPATIIASGFRGFPAMRDSIPADEREARWPGYVRLREPDRSFFSKEVLLARIYAESRARLAAGLRAMAVERSGQFGRAGPGSPPDLEHPACARAAEIPRELKRGMNLLEIALAPRAATPRLRVRGLPASAGRAIGAARIIRSPAEFAVAGSSEVWLGRELDNLRAAQRWLFAQRDVKSMATGACVVSHRRGIAACRALPQLCEKNWGRRSGRPGGGGSKWLWPRSRSA
jgi:hypothetical protein